MWPRTRRFGADRAIRPSTGYRWPAAGLAPIHRKRLLLRTRGGRLRDIALVRNSIVYALI